MQELLEMLLKQGYNPYSFKKANVCFQVCSLKKDLIVPFYADSQVARWTNLSTHRCESLGNEEQANFESTTVGDNDGNIISNLTLVFT